VLLAALAAPPLGGRSWRAFGQCRAIDIEVDEPRGQRNQTHLRMLDVRCVPGLPTAATRATVLHAALPAAVTSRCGRSSASRDPSAPVR
jgi:hypothetical protein